MDNISNVVNFIDERIPIKFSYENIKNRIDIDKYIVRDNKKFNYKILAIAFSLALVFVTSLSVIFKENKVEYLTSNIQLYYTDKELVNSYNNIFVAKVNSIKETKYHKDNHYDVPYTYYDIDVIDSLKGEVSGNSSLCFYGGNKGFKNDVYLRENDELIKENEYYLFFTYSNENNLVLSQNNQKVLLKDFDESISLEDQNGECKYVLKRFINVINKLIGNEKWYISSPILPPKEELADLYDYNSIIKINNKIPVDLYTSGEGSDVATMFYNIEVVESFKNESYEGNLCCFGVDYWKEENVSRSIDRGVDILEDNTIYFMLANKKSNDKNKDRIKNNQRINSEDYIIEGNYQLIKLDNYDYNKSFEKQVEEIKNIINEYIGKEA